jgi:hypothetical protein
MLPCRSKLAQGKGFDPTVYLSACIIVAQLVMVPTASLVGRLVNIGRNQSS